MKRFSLKLGLVLAALTVSATATSAHAGPRPIRAGGQGYLYDDGFHSQLIGLGKGEHLGGCVLVVTLDSNQLFETNIVATYVEINAVNGDSLFATVDSEFDPETGMIAATITFAGGTGRFADASGSALLLIAPDTYWFPDGYPVSGTGFSWDLKGTVDY